MSVYSQTVSLFQKRAAVVAVGLAAVFAAGGARAADGVTLSIDKVQQRYPWNGYVDIDYTVTLGTDVTLTPDDCLELYFCDESVTPAVTNRANDFIQAPLPLTAGSHRITWNANSDGVTNFTSSAAFHLAVAHYPAQYMVIDVSAGSGADAVYPVTYLDGAPGGGFNAEVYKGDKIVLRRIRPGSFVGTLSFRAAFSKPFYIGIFEITQKQYKNVMGTDPSKNKGDYRPVEQVSFNTIRGTANTTTHQYEWPQTTEVDPASFMGKLRAKCKAKNPDSGEFDVPVAGFDLPTEFQWEFACRATTTGNYNLPDPTGLTEAEQRDAVARTSYTVGDGKGGYSQHTVVGMYEPNFWGLYDMIGNVSEWCRDFYSDGGFPGVDHVDPKGVTTPGNRVVRGGSWVVNSSPGCTSGSRWRYVVQNTYEGYGFRLSRDLP